MLINSAGQVVTNIPKRFHSHAERTAFFAPLREVQAPRSSTGPMFSIESRARPTTERQGDDVTFCWVRPSGPHILRIDSPRKSAVHWDRPIRQESRRKARQARKARHG